MELSFLDINLRQICEDSDASRKALGEECSINLQTRLSDLRAAPTLQDVIVGRLMEVEPVPNLKFKIDICGQRQLIFAPNALKLQYLKGKIDKKQIRRIKIVEIKEV